MGRVVTRRPKQPNNSPKKKTDEGKPASAVQGRRVVKRKGTQSVALLSVDELVVKTKLLMEELHHARLRMYDAPTVARVEKQLQEIRAVLLKRNPDDKVLQQVSTYPEVDDPNFMNALVRKKEFATYRYTRPQGKVDYDEEVDKACGASGTFRLTLNQKFLKNFLSPNTHYNSVLLYHETGSGKTCSALSIAEQFKSVFSKKIIILTPPTLKANFLKQLFDVDKVDMTTMSARNQCVGQAYLDQVPDRFKLTKKELDVRVNQIIRNNYQFYSFIEFANLIKSIEDRLSAVDSRTEMVEAKVNSAIKDMFSDCMIIIDEAHNVRADNEETSKQVPPIVLKVLRAVTNVKLLVLTATPMFNEAPEIVWLINLILANEKRPLIESSDIFSQDGSIKPTGQALLNEVTRGYVSFMRGQKPFSFPTRLYPSINKDPRVLKKSQFPKFDIYNQPLGKEQQLERLELINATMNDYQTTVYSKVERTGDNEDKGEESKKSNLINSTLISNIAFPTVRQDSKGNFKGFDVKDTFGERGFYRCFDRVNGSKMLKVQYNSLVRAEFGEFLHPENIGKYSSKMKNVVDYILNAEGIVFVYSRFIEGGILPLAIALEHAGFVRADGHNILSGATKVKPLYVGEGKRATYTVLCGQQHITHPSALTKGIEEIKAEANKDGNIVKVVLGTDVTAEGIDFKCIREVHVLEPWYHLNKLEQIVGRAVRTCSHVALPPEKRNVTVFHHASLPNYYTNKGIEPIDLRIYRMAELKQKRIRAVEDILQSNAIDCVFNKDASYFDPQKLGIAHDIVTSQRVKVKGFLLGDHKDFSRYKPVTCSIEADVRNLETDVATYGPSFYKDDVGEYIDAIASAFPDYGVVLTLAELAAKVQRVIGDTFDTSVLQYTLNTLVTERLPIQSMGLNAHLIYFGQKYTMMPFDEPFSYISTSRRHDYKPIEAQKIKLLPVNSTNSNAVVAVSVVDIKERAIEHTARLFKNAEKLLSNPTIEQIAIDCVIDRLKQAELVKLASNLYATAHPDPFQIKVKAGLVSGGVIIEADKTYLRSPFAVRIDKRDVLPVFIYDAGSFRPLSQRELAIYESKAEQMALPAMDTTLKAYKAYMYAHNDNVDFKMIGKEEKSTGTVCHKTAPIKVDMLRNMIGELDPTLASNVASTSKKPICEVYEFLLRLKEPMLIARPYKAATLLGKK